MFRARSLSLTACAVATRGIITIVAGGLCVHAMHLNRKDLDTHLHQLSYCITQEQLVITGGRYAIQYPLSVSSFRILYAYHNVSYSLRLAVIRTPSICKCSTLAGGSHGSVVPC